MNNFKSRLTLLPRKLKVFIVLINDITFFYLSSFLALSLRFDKFFLEFYNQPIIHVGVLIFIPIFFYTGLYSNIFRYQNFSGLFKISQSILIYTLIITLILYFSKISNFPRSFGVVQSLIFFSFVSISRILFVSIYNNFLISEKIQKSKLSILIYGVNDLSTEVANKIGFKNIFGFISDDKSKKNEKVNNKKIFSVDDINEICKLNYISHVIICNKKNNLNYNQSLKKKFTKFAIRVRFIDSLANELFLDTYKNLNEINLDDILDREIEIDYNQIAKTINNKRILITGAGGSIGSELSNQIANLKPDSIVLVDNSEYNIYKLEIELNNLKINNKLFFKLVSVTNSKEIDKIFKLYKPQIVFHAAAYKHVPILETNLISACNNNILGTYYVLKKCYEYNIEKFVLISTDKAVRPTNIMGATKRFAEKISMTFAHNYKNLNTEVNIVRFGNVIGSTGSVIPRFNEQLKNKENITITHPDITRYFMKISEAIGLVLYSSTINNSGNIYFLNMGKPIKIYDIAMKMIKLYGYTVKNENLPNGDIGITYTGLRKGEKMFEELFYSDHVETTFHKDIYLTNDNFFEYEKAIKLIENLEDCVTNSDEKTFLNLLLNNIEDFKNDSVKISN